MKIIKIESLNIPKSVKSILRKQNYNELYPPQAEAIKKGVLNGKNLLLAIPTASGKTLIAELAMLKSILEKLGKAVYLVPLRALANEKFEYFKKWEKIGIKVNITTSDYDRKDPWLKNYDLIISTNEKFDSLIRHHADWIKDITVFVFDEVHLLNDAHRGPTLEILITNVMQFVKTAQIIALSATVKNADQMADWLNASYVISDWRPVKLNEGVYFDGTIYFPNNEIKIPTNHSDPVVDLVLDTFKNKKQALIFTDTRRSAASSAKKISKSLFKLLRISTRNALEKIAKKISSLGEKTKIRLKLTDLILKGVAFHHAGLIFNHRKLIEKSFKENIIKILCATPTLAAGVNLPARRVIISKVTRFDADLGFRNIPVLEYKQFAGRAGRPGFDSEGESILISKTEREKDELMERYVLGEPEPIHSNLEQQSVLRTHILALIARKERMTKKEVKEFIKKTFYAHQMIFNKSYDNLIDNFYSKLDYVINFLLDEKLIEEKNTFLIPTNLGRRIAQLYIVPQSGIILKNVILELKDIDMNIVGILHLISRTEDIPKLYLRKREYDDLIQFARKHHDDFFFEIEDDQDYEITLSEMKITSFLYLWINEFDENRITSRFAIGSGDIYRYVQLYDWLIYALHEIAKLYKKSTLTKFIRNLQIRIKYGVKEELLELVSLKGIGRVKARILYNHGYTSIDMLKRAKVNDLIKLDFFGLESIKSIYDQIGISLKEITQISMKNKTKLTQKSIDDYI